MSKPGADPASGISSGDALRPTERHPACRRRETQPGSCTERENLAGDAKGKFDHEGTTRGRLLSCPRIQCGVAGRTIETGSPHGARKDRRFHCCTTVMTICALSQVG